VTADGREFVVVRVRDGEVVDTGNWVYAWVDAAGGVLYVGATGSDPETRVWLHLHDPDPEVRGMRARFADATTAPLDVLAMRVPEEISRADVRDVLGARLADEGLLAEDAITDDLQLVLDPAPEAVELADRYIARLRVYLEQRDAAVL
jgi:hypothetical protein